MPRAAGSPAAHDLPAPDAGLTARFTAALEGLCPEIASDPKAQLGLAVSGGPDSCALLLLACAALPGRVEAATVDHGLRPESGAEAASVAALCKRLGVPHRTLAVKVAPGNVQSRARAARYKALGDWAAAEGLAALATAHHADDQAETLLMRLNRASGVAGLAGARARGTVPNMMIPLLRPLLGWRREDLAGIVKQAGIEVVSDPSNLDDAFDRVRLRKDIAGADWLDIEAIARSASHLADADAALDWAALRAWDESVTREGNDLTYRPGAPRAISLRVIARIVTEMDAAEPRGSAIARLFEALSAGESASIGSLVARPGAEGWRFARAPKRKGG